MQSPSSGRGSLLFRRERFQCVEDSVGARIDAERGQVAPANHPLRIDHEERALGYAVAVAIGAILPRDAALGLEIRQQREMQLAIARERRMAPGAIDRDTD